ncbi:MULTISPECIES: hypothetical protein [Microbacterium]|uniref:Tetratricopeptide repeat protein n=1 Tax=Microbacterium aquilitoris TaxID=3067307 RepID=A0ABU3GGH9_9MICO|nr:MULTISPECIES: hypothetical protein [unclassified Microbacterium]MDT3329813.1 hypothetical protein [Microbacterium sp. KSW-18]MDT3345647.1 hypothetical protein [Microbacterium sp. KSW2-22]SDH17458.1 hypothetical protein SAMN04488590_2757 [Microbacterium sp. 77mftsu3.1]
MGFIKGYDPETLREIVDLDECQTRLTELGDQRSLAAMLEKVWLLKVLGRLDEALVVSEESVRLARMAGTRKDLLRARMLHATVQQFRGAYAAAIHELNTCVEEAEGQGWSAVAAFGCQHRGKVHFDAHDDAAARADFKKALFLRQEAGAPEDQLESTLLAIDAVDRRRNSTTVAG